MNIWRPFKDYEWLVLIAVLLFLCTSTSASGNGSGTDVDVDVRQSNDMNNQTAGDIKLGDLKIGGGNSYALANVLGGVDISGCIITKQTTIIVFAHQYYVYDPWCVARELDMVGRYEAAAKMRCTEKMNKKLYGSKCESIMNFDPGEAVVPNPHSNPNSEPAYDYEAAYAAQQEEINYVREQLATVIEQQQQQQTRTPTRAVYANTAVIEAMKQKEVEREAKEAVAKAFFRAKYEAAQQREVDNED